MSLKSCMSFLVQLENARIEEQNIRIRIGGPE